MWTICWENAENDEGEINSGWERFKTREDIINLANTLVREYNVYGNDILIFPPKANKFKIPYNEIEN